MASSIKSNSPVNEPPDTELKQQRMKAWNPILDPVYVILALLLIGASFVPIGTTLLKYDDKLVEIIKTYDSIDEKKITSDLVNECVINVANEGRTCTITFNIEKDMDAPILLYYEIQNFNQNHREYTTSRDDAQLLGSLTQTALDAKACEPMNILDGVKINPCGLIANSFFNDVIKLVPNSVDVDGNPISLLEEGIAWQSDLDYKFAQPNEFKYEKCTSCDDNQCKCNLFGWTCKNVYQDPKTNECYVYSYPEDDTTQYLYETYPDTISPIEGVTNEHFVVWMRVASKPTFRKLYGYFNQPLKAGTTVTLDLTANWDVKSFKGTKSLILTTTNVFGGKNPNLGKTFIGVGIFCLVTGVFFGLKQLIKPRRLAQKKHLRYKED